jgi:peptide-methionine (S)-S-oxide reductase
VDPRLVLRAARAALTLAACGLAALSGGAGAGESGGAAEVPRPEGSAVATFAGGCFWCMEPPFDALPGVLSTTSGYTGGHVADPSYDQVSEGGTGHAESVQVVYDPQRVRYAELLEVFWRNVDPLDGGGQFCDRGAQYRSAIFVHDAEQRRQAEESKREVTARLGKPVATQIVDAARFYPAEAYHQDYARRNPIRYRFYRGGCGRDARLRELWGEAPAH